jgi:hypothetical protein
VAARDSFAGYTSALVLVGTAALSVLIYVVRRHRVDDYGGRYLVWAWAAVLWLLASVDAVADLRTLVRVVCVHLTGQAGPGDGIAWWLAPWLLAVAFVALRASLDLRASWLALVSFLLALACWTIGFVLQGASVPLLGDMEAAMLRRGLSLGGDWLLFCSSMAYGRHVLLEAHGELPTRRVKEKKEVRKLPARRDDVSGNDPLAAKAPAAANMRIDTPHAVSPTKATAAPQAAPVLKWAANTQSQGARSNFSGPAPSGAKPAASPPAVQASQVRTQFVNDSHGDSQAGRTLSRAERKRLRREQRARERDE